MEYVEGTNEYVPVRPEYKKSIDALYAEAEKQALSGNTEALVNVKKEFGENPYELKNILKYWIRSKNEDLKIIPTDSIVMKVDKEAVRRSGMMIPVGLQVAEVAGTGVGTEAFRLLVVPQGEGIVIAVGVYNRITRFLQ